MESFNFSQFHSALDAARRRRRRTWRQVAGEAEISPSSLTRLSQGSHPDVDTVASLARWAGLDLNAFVAPSAVGIDPLTRVTSYLHSDPRLSREQAEALALLLQSTYSRLTDGDEVGGGYHDS
jgi:transcriptional regulator with XRE-family HTH domain